MNTVLGQYQGLGPHSPSYPSPPPPHCTQNHLNFVYEQNLTYIPARNGVYYNVSSGNLHTCKSPITLTKKYDTGNLNHLTPLHQFNFTLSSSHLLNLNKLSHFPIYILQFSHPKRFSNKDLLFFSPVCSRYTLKFNLLLYVHEYCNRVALKSLIKSFYLILYPQE